MFMRQVGLNQHALVNDYFPCFCYQTHTHACSFLLLTSPSQEAALTHGSKSTAGASQSHARRARRASFMPTPTSACKGARRSLLDDTDLPAPAAHARRHSVHGRFGRMNERDDTGAGGGEDSNMKTLLAARFRASAAANVTDAENDSLRQV
jgi:hypothetical protein